MLVPPVAVPATVKRCFHLKFTVAEPLCPPEEAVTVAEWSEYEVLESVVVPPLVTLVELKLSADVETEMGATQVTPY